MDDEEVIEAPEGDEMGTIILMLGLYLIVLAFFILLNAMAEPSEEKIQQAAESVADGFGFQMDGPVKMRDDVAVTINPVFEMISRDIQSVMESYISDNNFRFSTNADQMVLSIDTKRIFAPGSIRIRPSMAYFFEDVARIVASKRPGSRLVTEVVVKNDNTDLGNSKIPLNELAGRRAALFIRALAERGVNTKYVSASAQFTGESTVDIFFKIIILDHLQSSTNALEKAAPRTNRKSKLSKN